jgi:hypothetical protein
MWGVIDSEHGKTLKDRCGRRGSITMSLNGCSSLTDKGEKEQVLTIDKQEGFQWPDIPEPNGFRVPSLDSRPQKIV